LLLLLLFLLLLFIVFFFDCCFTAELVLEVSDETSGPLVNAAQCINFSGKLTLNFTRPPEDSEEIQLISGQCITGDPTVQLLNEKVCVCVCVHGCHFEMSPVFSRWLFRWVMNVQTLRPSSKPRRQFQ
jgi:hypothetical protein